MTNKITLNSIKKVQSASDFLKLLTSTDDLSTLELPIDINTLIQRIESVEYSDDPSFENWNKSGFTKVERDANLRVNKINIWCNPGEVSYRRRFTTAHELGHLVHDILPEIDDPNHNELIVDTYHRDGRSSFEERRADNFAGQFLMPTELVKRESNKLVEQLKRENRKVTIAEIVQTLAGIFEVSTQAMGIRLKKLSYIKSF